MEHGCHLKWQLNSRCLYRREDRWGYIAAGGHEIPGWYVNKKEKSSTFK